VRAQLRNSGRASSTDIADLLVWHASRDALALAPARLHKRLRDQTLVLAKQ
jgi:hypothetical protein